jgi:hypothetical protein
MDFSKKKLIQDITCTTYFNNNETDIIESRSNDDRKKGFLVKDTHHFP